MKYQQIYLASASPRRRLLLEQIDVQFECLAVSVDEKILPNENATEYALRLAVAKAQAGWDSALRLRDKPVLGADTIVVCDGVILGKPKDENDAVETLLMLSGKRHEVITAIALVKGDRIDTAISVSTVLFRDITREEAHDYWASGEPCDKAGSYGIQGIAAIFIKEISGSHSGIMGLPLYETANLLQSI